MAQSYNNHKKYYPLHHFVFLPATAVAAATGFYKACASGADQLPWMLFGISSFFILFLAIMLRQHYALGNQNRIVRLEFRLRYFELFQQSAAKIENQLSFGQVAALRFAPDEEFKALLDLALNEQLSPATIKQKIKSWQADHMRV